MDRLMTVMGACGEEALVQLALTPAPALLERWAKWRYKRHEDHLSRERREHLFVHDRSLVEEVELRGGLEVQHRPLYFADLRVLAPTRRACEQIASELRAEGAENRLVERGTSVRHGLLGLYRRRVQRGEGNPCPGAAQGGDGLDRAGRAVACALDRLRHRAVRPRRSAAGAGAARDHAPARRGGAAARRARAGCDPPADAPPEHRRAGHRGAGQVELPRGDRGGGPAQGALRGDRARPQGRRRRGRRERGAGSSARARCWTSPTRPAASTRSPWTPRRTRSPTMWWGR